MILFRSGRRPRMHQREAPRQVRHDAPAFLGGESLSFEAEHAGWPPDPQQTDERDERDEVFEAASADDADDAEADASFAFGLSSGSTISTSRSTAPGWTAASPIWRRCRR